MNCAFSIFFGKAFFLEIKSSISNSKLDVYDTSSFEFEIEVEVEIELELELVFTS